VDYGHHFGAVDVGAVMAIDNYDEMQQSLDALAKALTLFERIEALRAQNTLMSVQLDKASDHMSWAVRRLAKKCWRYACQLQPHME
jgi:hypothetical protein